MMRSMLCAGVLAVLLAAKPGVAADKEADSAYRLGRGLRLPAFDLTLAGYSSTRVRDLEDSPARFDLHDLSLFVIWEPLTRWKVFGELEFEHLLTIDEQGLNTDDIEVVVERLYVDYTLNGRATLRAGRFLTPFGYWNLVHADPLVWTVTRPLVTSLAIPDHASGAMLTGSLPLAENSLEYSVYIDDSENLDPVHGEASFEEFDIRGVSNNFDHAAGVQLRYAMLDDHVRIGASYAAFDLDDAAGHQHAFGFDGMARWRRFELSGEAIYRINTRSGRSSDWGGYALAVAPLAGPLYAVGRFEYYRSGLLDDEAARVSGGFALRPHPALTLKFEYHDGNNARLLPDGWEVSCGILF